MVDDAKLEIAAAVGPVRELAVERDLHSRIVGIADDPEIAAGDLGGLDAHVPGLRRARAGGRQDQHRT
ncbi:hypothetical protein [Methylobacterium oryzae]|uniref:hypothetical protein n=1 Tax=Methylobacterium oryzae TaxID=334852 RepID=UPI002F354488